MEELCGWSSAVGNKAERLKDTHAAEGRLLGEKFRRFL